MPPPYTITTNETVTFLFEGEPVTVEASGARTFDDACAAAEFLAPLLAVPGAGLRGDDMTREAYAELRRECRPVQQPPPSTPPQVVIPGEGEPDARPPQEGETARSLGAPTPRAPVTIEREPAPAGQSDGRSLLEQYLDPRLPLPDYDIEQILRQQGVPPAELDAERERVRRSVAPRGRAHPVFSRDTRRTPETSADPVSVFSGQYTIDVTDVEIASVGLPLRFIRHYRSGDPSWGAWGFNWDHSYNVYLRELDDGDVAVWTGRLQEELYHAGAAGFEPPTGAFRLLERMSAPASGYRLTERDGTILLFERPPGWPDAERIPLVRIADRHGNAHTVVYDAQGRLVRVADAYARFLELGYGDCGLVESLRDHLGRQWRYVHDAEAEHLVEVVTPPAAGFPDGITTTYEYESGSFVHPALRHNLVLVRDHYGQVMVENDYGNDPSTDDFNRVVEQRAGGLVTQFHAEVLQIVPETPYAINVPALRVEVIDPGVLYVFTFNYRGDLLDERFRLSRDGSFRLVANAFQYDEQGNLAERREPDGRGQRLVFDAANPDPRARGNLLRLTELASPLAPAPSRDVLRATYEPRFGQLQTTRDALGNETRYVYDYQLGPGGTGLLRELRLPPTTDPDGIVRQALETFEYNLHGQLISHDAAGATHTFDYAAAGPAIGYLTRVVHAAGAVVVEERYERDGVGSLTARITGAGDRTAYTLDALGRVTRVDEPDGSVWELVYDAHGRVVAGVEPRGDYDDPVLLGRPIRHEFGYDVLGRLVSEVHAANTVAPRRFSYRRSPEEVAIEVVDPLGRQTLRTVDERGLVLHESIVDAAGVVALERSQSFNRAGDPVRMRLVDGPEIELLYDGFGAVRSVKSSDGMVLTYERDARSLIERTAIEGPPATGASSVPLAARRVELDERGHVRALIDELFETPNGLVTDVVTSIWLDDAGRPERIREPGGLVRERRYGPTDVVVFERDSLGNQVRWILDRAGRLVITEVTEEATAGATAVALWRRSYDARGRVAADADPLDNTTRYIYDTRGLLRDAVNPRGQVLSLTYDAVGQEVSYTTAGATVGYERDAAGRVMRLVDPTGLPTEFEHDALDRLIGMRRSDGRQQRWKYRPSGAVERFVDWDGTTVDYSYNPVELPITLTPTAAGAAAVTSQVRLDYDGLRRVVRAEAGGAVQRFRYDSLSRLREESGLDTVRLAVDATGRTRTIEYPDGRRDTYTLDELSRLRSVTLDTDGSLGLTAHLVPVGSVLATLGWAGYVRPGQVNTLGLTTDHDYDGASRLVGVRHRDGAGAVVREERAVRDPLGLRRVLATAAPTADTEVFRFDGLSRIEQARAGVVTAATLPPPDATQAAADVAIAAAETAPFNRQSTFVYAPGNTPASRTDTDGAGIVLSQRLFTENALHQVVTVDQAPVVYDGADNVASRGSREYTYDAFRRLVEVRDGGVTVSQLSYDGLGRVHTVRSGAGAARRLVHLGDELLQETVTGAGGAVLAQYTPGPRLDQPLLVSTSAATYPLAWDGMGSLVAACDTGGGAQERYGYDVFGAPRILAPDGVTQRPASALGLAPRFLGRPFDATGQFYDFRDRAYDPDLFLFLQPDPFPFADGWCPYAFVGYNPVSFADPYGQWLHVVLGAVVFGVIGGVGAALKGGDLGDILAGAGAGAVGGAITFATGNPILGAAAAGGLAGAWSGGRAGYQNARGLGITPAKGLVLGGVAGGAFGATVGALSGWAGGLASNLAGTSAAGLINRSLLAAGARRAIPWVAARYGGAVFGGYVGGLTAGVIGNVTTRLTVDAVTGRPVTGADFRGPIFDGLAIDGPLGAVGAFSDRFIMISRFTGQPSNVLGAEGETLVARRFGLQRANGRQRLSVIDSGLERHPDFDTNETVRKLGAVLEVKNKNALDTDDLEQIADAREVATQLSAETWVLFRPGTTPTNLAPAPGLRLIPIPQVPLVTPVPVPFAKDLEPAK